MEICHRTVLPLDIFILVSWPSFQASSTEASASQILIMLPLRSLHLLPFPSPPAKTINNM